MPNFRMVCIQLNVPGDSMISYVGKRYDRFLEYSTFHCSRAGIPDEAIDLLHEVIIQLSKKDEDYLLRLCRTPSKCGRYKELDVLILRMIEINAHSLQAPYRWKAMNAKIDTNVDIQRLKIIEEQLVEVDKSEVLLKEFRLVNWVFRGLELNDLERAVFEYRFINNELLSEWSGSEAQGKLYKVYNSVVNVIQSVLFKYELTGLKPKTKLTSRESELVIKFLSTHKMKLRSSRCLKI